ncbi:MAG: DJ-1/PfpI family protein [Acidimicrobiales bacterium]|nr:DJ-1/PfpI family protein [Acidimicrobiales bacterium]MCB1016835.1 DJ-1/PfpI family protein [Acidimicrobiales bacterium]MCB9371674.1 DJ-1/PfpI family protein [Microthrixaceae bacterium]
MDVAVLVHEGVSAAEALAPVEVLRAAPGVDVSFVAHRTGAHTTQGRPGVLVADRALEDLAHPDVVIVPGGLGVRRLVEDPVLLGWLAEAHRTSQWTAAVSTGALVLGAAGVLEGCSVSGHWLLLDELAGVGAHPSARRLVRHGRVVTAAGSASAFDLGVLLVEQAFGAEAAAEATGRLRADPDGTRPRRRRHRSGPRRVDGRYVVDDPVDSARARRWRRRPRTGGSASAARASS